MNAQSKIAGTLLIGLALGAALALLFSYLKQDEASGQESDGSGRAAANAADEWSDLNDSLGG